MNIHNQFEVGQWVQALISQNDLHRFYVSTPWLKLRAEILQEYKNECQHCKTKGWYKKANTVHHVQYVRRHPSLALSKTYIWQGEECINLIPLCHSCHEEVHGYRQKKKKEPLCPERWD